MLAVDDLVLSLRPGIDPGNVAWVDETSDLAVDCTGIAVDDENRLIRRTDEVSAKEARTGDRTVRSPPFGQMTVHRFANTRDDVHFACLFAHETHEMK